MVYVDFPDWKKVVRGKHLIFDSDAIISILSYKAENLLEMLKNLGVTFNYTHPVLLELMATGSESEKLKRTSILNKYNFTLMPMTATELEQAVVIQNSKPLGYKGNPSVADYYLGATLARLTGGNTFLLTSNIKDFPMPIFIREAFIPLLNTTDFKAISILSLDRSQLLDD